MSRLILCCAGSVELSACISVPVIVSELIELVASPLIVTVWLV